MRLIRLDSDNLDRCSSASCRQPSTTIYNPGATPANPRSFLAFCDRHLEAFAARADSRHDRGRVELTRSSDELEAGSVS